MVYGNNSSGDTTTHWFGKNSGKRTDLMPTQIFSFQSINVSSLQNAFFNQSNKILRSFELKLRLKPWKLTTINFAKHKNISLENLLWLFPHAALFENRQTFCNQLRKTCTIQANNHIHASCNWSKFIAQSTDWHRLKCIHLKFTAVVAYLWKTSMLEKAKFRFNQSELKYTFQPFACLLACALDPWISCSFYCIFLLKSIIFVRFKEIPSQFLS